MVKTVRQMGARLSEARIIMGMGAAGAIAALLLAIPSVLPPAVANEEPARTLLSTGNEIFPPPFDPGSLVRWDFVADPGISTEPIRQSTVRKIGYGRVETVTIVETASGIYSSDALDDPHVEYPGITRTRKADRAGISMWNGFGWSAAAPFSAGSFVTITPFEGGSLIVTDDGMCVVKRGSVRC